MKTRFGILLLLAAGCATEGSEGSEPSELPQTPDNASWLSYRDGFVSAEGHLVGEWDLVFRDEQALSEHFSGDSTDVSSSDVTNEAEDRVSSRDMKLAIFQQLSTGFEPSYVGNDARDIVYCVSNTVPNKATVVADMATATTDWLRNANVRFRYDSTQDSSCTASNAAVDFAVLPTTVGGLSGCGANKMLWSGSGGCFGQFGVLLVQYSALTSFPGVTGPGLLRHELGHILGFRHEHPWAANQSPCGEPVTLATADVTARRLTGYDQQSVMHYPQCGGVAGSDMVISTMDQKGAISVYGIPAAWYAAIL